MKHILVCITGGTFSALTERNVMDISHDVTTMIQERANKKYQQSVTFSFIQPVFMLSENLEPKDWEVITRSINTEISRDKKFDGIIVIHGSDTAPYTTAFLNNYYRKLSIPIVVTASNAPINESESNGWHNFSSCVDFILSSGCNGTYFIYRCIGNRKETFVFAANELREADVYSDMFSSSTPYVFGKMANGQLIRRENKPKKPKEEHWDFEPFTYQNKVLGIKPYPGMDYRMFNLSDPNLKAIIHQSYHSNTYNCRTEKEARFTSLLSFLDICKAQQVTLYLSDFPKDRMIKPLYETTIRLIKKGVIPVCLPFEAAYSRAIYAYNQKNVSPETLMMR